jgi:hypothetical protein
MRFLLTLLGILFVSFTSNASSKITITDFNNCRQFQNKEREVCLINMSQSMPENYLTVIDDSTSKPINETIRVIIKELGSNDILKVESIKPGNSFSLNGIKGKILIALDFSNYSPAEVDLDLENSGKIYSVRMKKSSLGRASGLELIMGPTKAKVDISDLD